jgi:hypothetical protein
MRRGRITLTADLAVVNGLVYGNSGKLLDVYRPATVTDPSPAVLLWHGRGPDERDVLAPLARATAELGVTVFVPDWRADAYDGGRTHLRESASFARRHVVSLGGNAQQIVLAGWSLGGKSALGVALNPSVFDGWRPERWWALPADTRLQRRPRAQYRWMTCSGQAVRCLPCRSGWCMAAPTRWWTPNSRASCTRSSRTAAGQCRWLKSPPITLVWS